MKRLLLASAAVLAAGCSTPAGAQALMRLHAHTGAVVPSTCPQGTADPNDGCTTASASALFQFANLLTPGVAGTAFQSGQTPFSTRPLATTATPSNEPFVDYPDGPVTPAGGWKDPLDQTKWPAGLPGNCPLEDHTTWWTVDCTSANVGSYTWRDFDMGPNPARAQANKGPVLLLWDNSSTDPTQQIRVTNNKFKLDDNCASGGIQMVGQQHRTPINFTIDHNSFDGNFPACRFGATGAINLATSGSQTIVHNLFDHVPGRAAGGEQGPGAPIIFSYNMMLNCEDQPQEGHGECEIWEAGVEGAGGPRTMQYNTVVLGADAFNGYTSTFYDTGIGWPLTSSTNDHNVVVVNRVGGWQGALSGSITGTIDDGAGGAGNIFTVTVDPGTFPIFPGTLFSGNGLTASVVDHVAGSPASGVGSKWRLECIYNGCNTTHTSAPGGPPYFGLDIPSVAFTTAVAYTWDNGITSAAGFEFGTAYSGQIKFSTNFIDKSGDDFGRYFVMISGSCGALTLFSGNKDLLTGASIDRWDLDNSTSHTCAKAP